MASDAVSQSPRTPSSGDTWLKVIFGSLPVLGSVPFLCWPHTSGPGMDPTEKKQDQEREDNRRQATDPKSNQAQTQSDSHQQATGTAPRKPGAEIPLWGPTKKLFHNSKRPRFRLRESERPRLRILCCSRPREVLSEHASQTR